MISLIMISLIMISLIMISLIMISLIIIINPFSAGIDFRRRSQHPRLYRYSNEAKKIN